MIREVLASVVLLAGSCAAASADSFNVLYAGSLVNLMEKDVGPAFDKADGESFQGFAAGSKALANQIKGKLRRADVFISADPKVNEALMGAANGNWVSWYVTFARSPLVIGYNPNSRFAADFKSMPWYKALELPGIKLGRTDPKLDPKGALTVRLLQRAEQVLGQPGLEQKVLGAPDNPAQVFPEETLVGRLQSGQVDAGFFYSTETSDLKIPSAALPKNVALLATYTITIPRDAPHAAAAVKFVRFFLGAEGRKLMRKHGLAVTHAVLTGHEAKAPAGVRNEILKQK